MRLPEEQSNGWKLHYFALVGNDRDGLTSEGNENGNWKLEMEELRRTLLTSKNALLLIIFFLLNLLFCTLQCNDTQKITLAAEELITYVEGYPSYVEQTLDNAEKMKVLGLLHSKGDYMRRNLEKTVEDFSLLKEIEPEFGENRGIVLFSDFDLSDFLLVGYGLYLILLFTGEYRKGLSLLIFSTDGGRRILGIKRVLILFAGMAGCSLLLYGSNLLTISFIYPEMLPARPLQSVPEFMKCAFPISIGAYLLRLVIMKYFASCLIALFLFAFVSLFKSVASIVAAGLLFLLEFLGYKLILSTSVFNYLKFLNLYALLRAKDGYIYYYNMNFFGRPVTLLTCQCLFGALLMVVCIIVIIIGHGRRQNSGISIFHQLWDRLAVWLQKRKPIYSACCWEARKILISQFGLLFIVVILYMAISSASKTEYRDLRNRAELMYYEEFGGEITPEKMEEARRLERKLNRFLGNAIKNMENSGGDEEAQKQNVTTAMRISEYQLKLPAIQRVLANMESAYDYMERTGAKMDLVEPFAYEMFFILDRKTYIRNLLYSLICSILVFSGVMNYEKVSNMEMLLRSLKYGRREVFWHKILWVVLLSFLFSLPIHLVQFIRIAKIYPFVNLSGLVQSMEMFRSFPVQIPLYLYMALVFLFRCSLSVVCGIGVCLLGRYTKSRVSCIVISLILLIGLIFLYMMIA